MKNYLAILHKDKGSDYGVSFPDFPGCVASGSTLEEAQAEAAEALAFHILGMIEDGEAVPDPSDVTAIKVEDGGILIVVPYAPEAKSVRINITVREDHLTAIDKLAERDGKSRSAFMVEQSLFAFSRTELPIVERVPSTGSWTMVSEVKPSTKGNIQVVDVAGRHTKKAPTARGGRGSREVPQQKGT